MNRSQDLSKKSGKPVRKKAVPDDRRVQKTRKLLSDAFVALVIEKGYDAVSIRDITEKANVGRSTFYFHYESKEQLMLWGHDHFANTFTRAEEGETGKGGMRTPGFHFLELYRHVSENRQLVEKVVHEKGGDAILKYLFEVFRVGIRELHGAKAKRAGEDGKAADLDIDAAAAAETGLIQAWMRMGMTVSPEEMARKSQSILDRLFG